ncbi:MAG: hypothetical protein NTV22_18580 [bacterium]|nr:hypothetical protein [bacterium]
MTRSVAHQTQRGSGMRVAWNPALARTAFLLLLLPVLAAGAASFFGKGGATPGVAGDFAADTSLADAYDTLTADPDRGESLANQYEALAAEANRRWSLDHGATGGTACAASACATNNFTSLRDAYASLAAQEALLLRLADPSDPLNDLERYQAALRLPGIARQIYDRAYLYFWQRDYARAEKLFGLLVAPTNPDGFTKGNSHYWLAHLLYARHGDAQQALPHFLQVHAYPACLVFTACAYLEAAQIYHGMGQRDIALALYATQIPSIDYWRNEHSAATASLPIAFEQGDVTNVAVQIVRLQRAACVLHANCDSIIMATRRRLARTLPASHCEELLAWAHYWYSPMQYETERIQRAMSQPDLASNSAALTDMLLHGWPSMDEVAQCQPEILTNRPLSNNIFPQRRRALP